MIIGTMLIFILTVLAVGFILKPIMDNRFNETAAKWESELDDVIEREKDNARE